MTRIDDDTLSLHLEVALAGAAPALLDGLVAPDWRRRHAAAAGVARHLAERLRCFDIRTDQEDARLFSHPSLFPQDLGLEMSDGHQKSFPPDTEAAGLTDQ